MIEQKYIDALEAGEIVAFPTETVYGLGAAAFNPGAIKKIYVAKGRPSDNPLIVHIANMEQWSDFVSEIPETANSLAKTFWPGPLTIVLKKKPDVLDAITAGLDSVAVRMPDHPLALELIEKSGPLVAPSANISGRPSPTKAEHVSSDFGDTILVLDGGSTKIGLESTVLDLTSSTPTILRPGSIIRDQLERVLQQKVSTDVRHETVPKSPGQKYSHYQPAARVSWLDSKADFEVAEALYLIQSASREAKNIINYGGNLELMAHELYDRFRQADKEGYSFVRIEPFDQYREQAVFSALLNRISKAVSKE